MFLPGSTADIAGKLVPSHALEVTALAATMCTSAAIMVTAVHLGKETVVRSARVPVVKMWSSLPQTIDGDLGMKIANCFQYFFVFLMNSEGRMSHYFF